MKKLNHMQSLRGIAALLVCGFHMKTRIDFDNLEIGQFLFGKGNIGVPIFFVISGFIMTFTTSNYGKNAFIEFKSFITKRIIRIVPLYYILSIAWMVLGGNFLLYFDSEHISRVYNSFLFLPQKSTPPVLFLGWSLNYEMFFYLLFGLTLFFKKKRYLVLCTFFTILICLGLIFKFSNPYLKMATDFINIYFLIGIIFGLFYNMVKLSKKTVMMICIIGVCCFMTFYFSNIITSSFLPVTLLVLSFLLLDKLAIPSSSTLVYLGNISYSLYLIHPFVQIAFRRWKTDNIFMGTLVFIIEIIAVIILSSISFELVEKRLTKFLRKQFL